MFEKNTKQVNQIIARIFAACTAIIMILVVCSAFGVFAFGKRYTMIILIAGLIITISPSLFIALTADAVKGVRERLLMSGMNDYIVKPIDAETLSGILQKYLPAEKIVPTEKT